MESKAHARAELSTLDTALNSSLPSYTHIKTGCDGVVVIITVQLYSTKPELRFCAGSNPARNVLEIHDGEDLWQWSRMEPRLNAFRLSTILKNNSSSSSYIPPCVTIGLKTCILPIATVKILKSSSYYYHYRLNHYTIDIYFQD